MGIILTPVVRGVVTVAGAAERLARSERHAAQRVPERWLVGFRREGVAALVHGNRGRQPAHTRLAEMREAVCGRAMGKDAASIRGR